MRKTFNKFNRFLNNKMNCATEKLSITNFKKLLKKTNGEATIGQVITILITVILGGALLAGLYILFTNVVLPSLTDAINDMFNYKG